ncbi:MAG TPA: hypothetical protein DIT84_03270 [Clostridiales bacterium]|nr:hypothetical protein [Clostridiales bacterium]
MNNFDSHLKKFAKEEDFKVPESVSKVVDDTLASLPDNSNCRRRRVVKQILSAAACLLLLFLVVLPNCSPAYAQALENIPVISSIIEVVTVRNYKYSDDNHTLDINVPHVTGQNSDAENYINKDIDEMTKLLSDRFYRELEADEGKGHGSVHVDYEVVTNTDKWFTLRLRVCEAYGSGNTYYKYYHIDKIKGCIVDLSDLAIDDSFYSKLKAEVQRQMKVEMSEDKNIEYWLEDDPFGVFYLEPGENSNFYWNDDGDLVIVFNKYDAAPGFMGTPEFTVKKSVLGDSLVPEYR